MESDQLKPRLGLNGPYEWWPAGPVLKEIEAAGFSWVQVPSPPPSVLTNPRLDHYAKIAVFKISAVRVEPVREPVFAD